MNKLLKLTLTALTALSLTACTRTPESKHLLESQGFTDVTMTGYSFFGCGQDDAYSDGFTAKTIKGQSVTGVVCGGLLKGSTIRFD